LGVRAAIGLTGGLIALVWPRFIFSRLRCVGRSTRVSVGLIALISPENGNYRTLRGEFLLRLRPYFGFDPA